MSYSVKVHGEITQIEKYHDVLNFLSENLASWNNFEDHRELVIKITKNPDLNALGVSVHESVKGKDIFGRS